MRIELLSEQDPAWIQTVNALRHDVYQLPMYVAMDGPRIGATPEAFLLADGDNIFFAPYLRRSCSDFSRPESAEACDAVSPYGYPGILLSDAARNTPGFPDMAMHQFLKTLRQNGICSVFLRFHPILNEGFTEIFPSHRIQADGKTVSIDLTLDEGKIWSTTRKSHQSTINRCKRYGLTARTLPFKEHLDEFLDIYNETMDRVKADENYYFDQKYFEKLMELGDRLHLGVVESEGTIVCASLFFESCGIVQAHLGGTLTGFLKQSPFNLLLHHMRLWAKERGNQYLHLGGGIGGKQDNLYTFKSGFSKQRHVFCTFRSVVDETRYGELLQYRAETVNKSVEELKESDFFPAYRAG